MCRERCSERDVQREVCRRSSAESLSERCAVGCVEWDVCRGRCAERDGQKKMHKGGCAKERDVQRETRTEIRRESDVQRCDVQIEMCRQRCAERDVQCGVFRRRCAEGHTQREVRRDARRDMCAERMRRDRCADRDAQRVCRDAQAEVCKGALVAQRERCAERTLHISLCLEMCTAPHHGNDATDTTGDSQSVTVVAVES